jgi:SAM-dependent methyltransferase
MTPNAIASTEDFEFAALYEAENYRKALLKAFRQHLKGNVLEVGAGIGQISEEIKKIPAVTKLTAVEPEPKFLARLQEVLPADAIVAGTAHDAPADGDWNTIVSINVLEHIERDEAELTFYRQLLAAQRGHLCLFVPARQEIYAPLDKDFGHFRRYSTGELRGKLDRAGFDVVTLRYYNFPGYFAWWLSFCLMKKRGFDIGAVRFYDRVVFPPVFWLEQHLCPPPIGQSVLAIVRARA